MRAVVEWQQSESYVRAGVYTYYSPMSLLICIWAIMKGNIDEAVLLESISLT